MWTSESINENDHPKAFQVLGPHKVPAPTWRDLFNSSWKDEDYKRTVIACLIQAVYLLELDRQENRFEEHALAPKWFETFNYKCLVILIDDKDGSIYGAILKWDRLAALRKFIPKRPSGAPRAVLALRGTLLKGPTIMRDVKDDIRLFVKSLKGSVRFNEALEALEDVSHAYGSHKVVVAGHSLGAAFAFQIGKSLAKQGLFIETHLFNPPSLSLTRSLKNKVKKVISLVFSNEDGGASVAFNNWRLHLYVNKHDYICRDYIDSADEKENARPPSASDGHQAVKLFVSSKGEHQFSKAHGLEQWWSDDLELQLSLHSKRICEQLK